MQTEKEKHQMDTFGNTKNWKEIAKKIFPIEYDEFKKVSGRRPNSVIYSDIVDDVKRRDLTINALFYDIETKEIVDLVGGLSDLQEGIIRTVGNPDDRFSEDPLRRLRAVRFACRLGYKLDPALENSLRTNSDLSEVSPERIKDEFLKTIISAKDIEKTLEMIKDLGFFKYIFPGLEVEIDLGRKKDPYVTTALILRKNTIQVLEKILGKLTWTSSFPTHEIPRILFMNAMQGLSVDSAFDLKKFEKKCNITDWSEVQRFCNIVGIDPGFLDNFHHYEITTSGDELLAQGLKGAEVGKRMREVEREKFSEIWERHKEFNKNLRESFERIQQKHPNSFRR